MDMRIGGIVVGSSNPVDPAPEVALHLFHQCTCESFKILHFAGIEGHDHPAELAHVIASAVGECAEVSLSALPVECRSRPLVRGRAVPADIGEMLGERPFSLGAHHGYRSLDPDPALRRPGMMAPRRCRPAAAPLIPDLSRREAWPCIAAHLPPACRPGESAQLGWRPAPAILAGCAEPRFEIPLVPHQGSPSAASRKQRPGLHTG